MSVTLILRTLPSNGNPEDAYWQHQTTVPCYGWLFADGSIQAHPHAPDPYPPQLQAVLQLQQLQPPTLFLCDPGTATGTFLNGQRVFGDVRLLPDDVIELAAGGPRLHFDLAPRTTDALRPTGIVTYHKPALAMSPHTSVVSGNTSPLVPLHSSLKRSPTDAAPARPAVPFWLWAAVACILLVTIGVTGLAIWSELSRRQERR